MTEPNRSLAELLDRLLASLPVSVHGPSNDSLRLVREGLLSLRGRVNFLELPECRAENVRRIHAVLCAQLGGNAEYNHDTGQPEHLAWQLELRRVWNDFFGLRQQEDSK